MPRPCGYGGASGANWIIVSCHGITLPAVNVSMKSWSQSVCQGRQFTPFWRQMRWCHTVMIWSWTIWMMMPVTKKRSLSRISIWWSLTINEHNLYSSKRKLQYSMHCLMFIIGKHSQYEWIRHGSKEQHKKMHSAEQILRAELAEKKNAESEIQWLELKADCEERSKCLHSRSASLSWAWRTKLAARMWSPMVTLFWRRSSRSERRPIPQSWGKLRRNQSRRKGNPRPVRWWGKWNLGSCTWCSNNHNYSPSFQ